MMQPHYNKPPLDPFAQKHAEAEKVKVKQQEAAASTRVAKPESVEPAPVRSYKPEFPV